MAGMTASQARVRALHRLRLASWAEGATLLLLLLVAVPLKRLAGWPEAVSVMGPVHGLAFLVYVPMVLQAWQQGHIRSADLAWLLLAAFVPFGAFLLGGVFRRRLQAVTGGV